MTNIQLTVPEGSEPTCPDEHGLCGFETCREEDHNCYRDGFHGLDCPSRKDCQTAKPTDGGWVEKFDKEFNKHGFCDSDCSDYWLGAARTGVKASKIKSFIRQTVSAAVLAERQRCVEAVGSIPMPQWDVPEIDGSMPDDPNTAADQMRISTVKAAIEAINRKSYEAQ